MNIEIKLLSERAAAPKRVTPGSAAFDLHANCKEAVNIFPGETRLIPTGIALNIQDPGVAAIILPRSGIGHKKGIVLGNLVGLIDSDYQGEIMVSCWNRNGPGPDPFMINPGDRIAQMTFIYLVPTAFDTVDEFSNRTARGEGGFGHTGVA